MLSANRCLVCHDLVHSEYITAAGAESMLGVNLRWQKKPCSSHNTSAVAQFNKRYTTSNKLYAVEKRTRLTLDVDEYQGAS